MKKFLIYGRSNVRGSLVVSRLLIFLYAINFYFVLGVSGLPTSFPTEPVQQDTNKNVALSQEQYQGPETVAVPDEKTGEQGNWVKKKQWLLKSFEVNNSIYNLALQIAEMRNVYSSKNDAISDELQAFYKNLGVGQGKLQDLFDSVERYLEKKKKKDLMAVTGGEKNVGDDRDYQAKVEVLDTQLKQLKDELEQLKLDMKSIEDIGRSLTQRLEKVDEQIVSAMNLAEMAKGKVEDLWEIIDDMKARLIYYDLANVEENLKVIFTYLKVTLATDFDTVLQNAKKQMSVASEEIKKLENKGLIIKDRSARIEVLKLQDIQKLEQEKMAIKKTVPQKDTTEGVKNSGMGLGQRIYNYCVDLFGKILMYFHGFWKTTSKVVNPVAAQPNAGQVGYTVPKATSSTDLSSTLPIQQQSEPTPNLGEASSSVTSKPLLVPQFKAEEQQAIPSMPPIR